MNIIPRDPWFNVNHFFDDFLEHRQLSLKNGFFEPRVDIIDKEDSYVFIADLPGVAKEDISVNLQDGVLTIEAKIDEETSTENDKVIRKERKSGFFSRRINIGDNISASDISAEFINGVLKLNAPKRQEKAKETHKIAIS